MLEDIVANLQNHAETGQIPKPYRRGTFIVKLNLKLDILILFAALKLISSCRVNRVYNILKSSTLLVITYINLTIDSYKSKRKWDRSKHYKFFNKKLRNITRWYKSISHRPPIASVWKDFHTPWTRGFNKVYLVFDQYDLLKLSFYSPRVNCGVNTIHFTCHSDVNRSFKIFRFMASHRPYAAIVSPPGLSQRSVRGLRPAG